MSIDNPPIYSGITFNSQFFDDNTGGLTQAQANALYLRKTFPDTASALETFNGGIKTDAINPTTVGGTLQIGHGSVTNNVEVASEASRSVVLHLGDGDTSSGAVHIQNGNDTTGNVAVLNGTYTGNSGNLNIMTSATYPVTYTGGNVNIQTGGSRGITTIGNSLSGFNVGCPTIKVNIVNPNTSSTLQLGVGSASTNVSLGTQVDRTGDIKIGSNALSSASSTGTLELGNVQFGSGQVSIADGFGQTANVVIGGGNAVVSGSNKIVIGKSGKTNTISGNTTLDTGTLNLSNSTINVNSPLTIGYTSAPSTNQIGGISSVFNATGLPLTTSPFAFISMTTNGLPLGNYIGRVYMHINPSAATAKIAFSTSGGSGISITGANEISYNASGTAADGFNNNLVFFFTVSNATTSSISYVLYSAVATSTITECNLYAMRIG
jgi:hypothetical protein